ncbi:MAG TPA: SDR family oxidoreductase [Candidatus Binatia bacterium]|nr:SDR family oxidoreductase [Candidatus Binatia bacterium]
MSVVIVTGGTFGIGKAITIELAKRGHKVVAFGLDARQHTSIAENGTALVRAEAEKEKLAVDALEADVSQAADVQRIVDFTREKHGRIDALVNNAAIGPLGTILDTSEELWDRVIEVNLKGYYLTCKAVLPHMIAQGGGSIVNVGSGAGWGKPNMFAYATSKGGIFALSAALAYDHFHQHIRVNTVVPGGGGLGTGMSKGRAQTGLQMFTPGGYTGSVSGRTGTPEDIAYTVCFLLSPEADIISGAIFDVGCFAHQGGPIPPRPKVEVS